MEKDVLFQRALSCEKLEELKPNQDELEERTWRARRWSREAPMTASKLLVQACEESEEFQTVFVEKNTKWREIMADEVPRKYNNLMKMGLSLVQGSQAEKHARQLVEN